MAPTFLEFRTPCSCSTHGCGRHHGLQMSAPVMGKQTVNAILTSVTAILCMLSCSTARVPVPEATRMASAFGDSSMASMPRRLQQDVAADPVAFLDVLGGEDPAGHLQELYMESGTTDSLGLWLLEAAGYAQVGLHTFTKPDPGAPFDGSRLWSCAVRTHYTNCSACGW